MQKQEILELLKEIELMINKLLDSIDTTSDQILKLRIEHANLSKRAKNL